MMSSTTKVTEIIIYDALNSYCRNLLWYPRFKILVKIDTLQLWILFGAPRRIWGTADSAQASGFFNIPVSRKVMTNWNSVDLICG